MLILSNHIILRLLFVLCAALAQHQLFRVSRYQLLATSISGSLVNEPPFRLSYSTTILGSNVVNDPPFGLLIIRAFSGPTLVYDRPLQLTYSANIPESNAPPPFGLLVVSQNRGSFAWFVISLPLSLYHMRD